MTGVETKALFEMLDRQVRFQAWIASSIATYTMKVGPKLAEVLTHHSREIEKQDELMKKLLIDREKES